MISHHIAEIYKLQALCSWITYSVNIDSQTGPCVQRHWSWCPKFFSLQIFFSKNVPGVLKRKIFFYLGGGGDFGVFGAPHAPTRGSRGVEKRYTSSFDRDRPKFWNRRLAQMWGGGGESRGYYV